MSAYHIRKAWKISLICATGYGPTALMNIQTLIVFYTNPCDENSDTNAEKKTDRGSFNTNFCPPDTAFPCAEEMGRRGDNTTATLQTPLRQQ